MCVFIMNEPFELFQLWDTINTSDCAPAWLKELNYARVEDWKCTILKMNMYRNLTRFVSTSYSLSSKNSREHLKRLITSSLPSDLL